MTSLCKTSLYQRRTLSTASRLQDWASLIALSRTQGSCTRPGDVPEVWGISQWVCGVAFGLARGNLLLPTWKLPTQSCSAGI